MRSLFLKIGLDRAIFLTLFSRGWMALSGLIGIYFISHTLTPQEQGYYYTYNSLIALQVFVELGLNYSLMQFASHEMAQLNWGEKNIITGEKTAKKRLQSLFNFAIKWCFFGMIIMIFILLPGGILFLKSNTHSIATPINTISPWVLLVVSSAFNLLISTIFSLIEGCGQVTKIAGLRLFQAIFSGTILWIVLSLNGGLYALAFSSIASGLVALLALHKNYYFFLKDLLLHKNDSSPMDWRTEIWPFHWRIATSWASGYLITQLFNPLVFHYAGPIAAGRMGMSLQIFNAINASALAWISTKSPLYGNLVAQKREIDLDKKFKLDFLRSVIFIAVAITCFFIFFLFLKNGKIGIVDRLLPVSLIIFLAANAMASHITSSEAIYLRAHKEEPFFGISIMHGITVLALSLILIPRLGISGAIYTQFTATLGVSLVFGNIVYFKRKKTYLNKINSNT